MLQLIEVKTRSEVKKEKEFEEYTQRFECSFKEKGEIETIDGYFSFGNFHGRINLDFKKIQYNITRHAYDYLQEAVLKTKAFETFLEIANGLEKENKEKYKPVLHSWEKIPSNNEAIRLLIQLESFDEPFEILFTTHGKKELLGFFLPQVAKKNPAYKGYIGWSEDVFYEVKHKTPYRMYFIID